MRSVIFSQCRDRRMGVVWLDLGAMLSPLHATPWNAWVHAYMHAHPQQRRPPENMRTADADADPQEILRSADLRGRLAPPPRKFADTDWLTFSQYTCTVSTHTRSCCVIFSSSSLIGLILSNNSVWAVHSREDNGSAGHGSSGSTNLSGSRGSRVSTRDPLAHDQVNKIPRTGFLWQWWCFILRALPLSGPDWKLQ